MRRITIRHLEAKIEHLNNLTNSPTTYSTKLNDGKYQTNVGNYHLYQAYGGVELHRTVNSSGGVTCPAWSGCVPKREAADLISVFICGIEAGKNN